jgi:hypothetical protein
MQCNAMQCNAIQYVRLLGGQCAASMSCRTVRAPIIEGCEATRGERGEVRRYVRGGVRRLEMRICEEQGEVKKVRERGEKRRDAW